jgi:hypothetical protein
MAKEAKEMAAAKKKLGMWEPKGTKGTKWRQFRTYLANYAVKEKKYQHEHFGSASWKAFVDYALKTPHLSSVLCYLMAPKDSENAEYHKALHEVMLDVLKKLCEKHKRITKHLLNDGDVFVGTLADDSSDEEDEVKGVGAPQPSVKRKHCKSSY